MRFYQKQSQMKTTSNLFIYIRRAPNDFTKVKPNSNVLARWSLPSELKDLFEINLKLQ